MSRVDRFGRQVTKPSADYAAAVVLGSGLVMSEVTSYVNLTATGTAFSGACELAGYDCTAVTGSPTITIYDNTSAAGTVIVPATTLTVGRTEFEYKRALTAGCHVVLSGTQTVNILVG
jgi:hypothetical protein